MDNWDSHRREAVDCARRDYGQAYEGLRFPTAGEARAAEQERAELLDAIGERAEIGAHGTKLDCRNLSPGCQACMAGGWSCLFVNGRCNTRCFYCPSEQDEESVPMTNAIPFPRPAEYLAYVERLGFTGVSFSGGEPLVDLERTLSYLGAVTRELGDSVHTWLYTNGILLTDEVARRLREHGLRELRVDISATGYRLDAVEVAARVFPTVTVEIPAIPEDEARLRDLLPRLAAAGVNHLNLHQLKATPHNLAAFSSRGYTYLHGEQLTVMESELCALRLLLGVLDSGLPLPINYCSLVYKLRHQRAAARRRAAAMILKPQEEISESGLLRQLTSRGSVDQMGALAAHLGQGSMSADAWALEPGGQVLRFSSSLWDQVNPRPGALGVTYQLARLVPSVTYRNPFVEVRLGGGRKIAVERMSMGEAHHLGPDCAARFGPVVLDPRWSAAGALALQPSMEGPQLSRLRCLDHLQQGLQVYL